MKTTKKSKMKKIKVETPDKRGDAMAAKTGGKGGSGYDFKTMTHKKMSKKG